MIAQNAIFSKWHSLPLAHLQTRTEHVHEHWAHWTKNKWWIIPAYPKSSHAFTFCARSSSPSLAIEEDSCPVQGSCDQIFLLLWNELLPISCLKHVNSHAWKLTPPKKQNHSKHMSTRSLKGGLHVMMDRAFWRKSASTVHQMWRRLTASTCSSSSVQKNKNCLWLVANTPQPRAAHFAHKNLHNAAAKDHVTIQNGHRITTPAHCEHKIRTAPQRGTAQRSKMATAPHRQPDPKATSGWQGNFKLTPTQLQRHRKPTSRWPPRGDLKVTTSSRPRGDLAVTSDIIFFPRVWPMSLWGSVLTSDLRHHWCLRWTTPVFKVYHTPGVLRWTTPVFKVYHTPDV